MPDQPAKTAKRRVKNPETFRERALKAADSSAKPQRRKLVRHAGARALKPVVKPLGRAANKAAGNRVFKPFVKLARLLGKVLFVGYLARSWQELKLVTWPSRKESRRLTFAVLVFAVVFGAAVAGVDWGLDKVFKQLLLK